MKTGIAITPRPEERRQSLISNYPPVDATCHFHTRVRTQTQTQTNQLMKDIAALALACTDTTGNLSIVGVCL